MLGLLILVTTAFVAEAGIYGTIQGPPCGYPGQPGSPGQEGQPGSPGQVGQPGQPKLQ